MKDPYLRGLRSCLAAVHMGFIFELDNQKEIYSDLSIR